MDLAIIRSGIESVSILLNAGDLHFYLDSEVDIHPVVFPGCVDLSDMCAADFDGDGDVDLALSNYANSIIILYNNSAYICGDIDGIEGVDILDIVFLINYIYLDGPYPANLKAADVDGIPGINILDIIYLINYIYKDGPDLICEQ
jgi:hypothetical protein